MEPRTKNCPFCDEEIKYAARKCKHCGEYLDEVLYQQSLEDQEFYGQPQTIRKWNPGVAALISLIIPGGGQMYKGHVIRGILWLIIVPIGYMMLIVPGIILHIICIISAASGNPYQQITTTSNKIFKKKDKGNFDPTSLQPFLIIAGLVVIALVANRIDEKGIDNFFQNSDTNTEEKISNPNEFQDFKYEVISKDKDNYYITIQILNQDKIELKTATRMVFEKESQLFNVHVFENAEAAKLYLEYFDKRNNIGTGSNPTDLPEKIKDLDKMYIPQLSDTYLGMIDFDTKTFWDHPLKNSE